MTPTLITADFGNDVGASELLAHSATFGAGEWVIFAVAAFCGDDAGDINAVTIDGVSATLDVSGHFQGAGGSYIQFWSVPTVPGLSADVLVGFPSAASNYIVWSIIAGSGGTLSLIAKNAVLKNDGAATPEQITSIDVGGVSPEIGDLVLGLIDIPPDSPASGWTEAFNSATLGAAMSGAAVYREASASGNQTATLTTTGIQNCDVAVVVYHVTADETPTLGADAGSYGVTGQSAGLLASRKIVSSVGAYVYSGVSAGLKKTSRLNAVAGAYALTGSPVALSTLRTLTANAGPYALSGAAAGLLYSQLVGMISGAYVLTGNAVALKRNSIFPLDAGAYDLSGKPATLTKMAAGLFASGSYTLTGITAELRKTNQLIAQTGSYSLIGHAASLRMLDDFVRSIERTYVVNAEDRVYSVNVEDRSYIVASEDRLNIVEG